MRIIKKIKNVILKILNHKNVTSESILNGHIKKGMIVKGRVRFFSRVAIGEPYMVQIGENVTVSTNVNFVTHDNSAVKIHKDATDYIGKIVIGDNCFIGTGSIILPGVSLANNTIVGAGSVVTKSIYEEGTVIAGNPAKKISSIDTLVEKYKDNLFDLRGKNEEEREREILSHPEKWIDR